MQTNILWTGREYYSLENCFVTTSDSGNEIRSTIVGEYQGQIYMVNYHIKTDMNWLPYHLNFISTINNKQFNFQLEKIENKFWILNNKQARSFINCNYIDISVTPFTNTLPINHLQLALNEEQQVNVIYINIFEKEVKPVQQFYKRLSTREYLYRNVPNDFEATIKIDDVGFVVDYPYLFKRKAIIKSN